jgi:hypothetical protein
VSLLIDGRNSGRTKVVLVPEERSMPMHPKTCAAVFYYETCNDETRKAREAAFDQIKCSKVAECKVEEIEEGRWKEFYCCSAHAQFYRDRNEQANREVFVITNL